MVFLEGNLPYIYKVLKKQISLSQQFHFKIVIEENHQIFDIPDARISIAELFIIVKNNTEISETFNKRKSEDILWYHQMD